MRRIAAASLVLALLAAAGCASGDAPLPGRFGVIEEAPPPPEPLRGAFSVPTPSVEAPPTREFSEEERRWFDAAWAAFRAGSPGWPGARAEWVAMGPEAAGLLAENLYRAMVASRARGAIHLVERARNELVLLGEPAVPILVGAAATRAVRTPDGEEIRVGQEILHDVAEALSLIGPPSVPGLMDVARSGEKPLVREAVWALGNVGDARSEELLLALAADGDWEVRGTAVFALRRRPSPRAGEALLARLEDPEGFVVQRAAEALAEARRTDLLPGVVDALERSVRDGRTATARAAVWTLRRVSGEDHGDDAAAWRRAISAGGR